MDRGNHYRRVLTAVRALIDPRDDTNSLVSIMSSVKNHPTELVLPDQFADMRATGADTVDPAKVEADIKVVQDAAETSRRYLNKYIAHLARNPNAPLPGVGEIEAACDQIREVLQKYVYMITGESPDLEAKIAFDWTIPLTVPWLPAADR